MLCFLRPIDYLNDKIKIDTFELKLLDVEFDIDDLKIGGLRFKYMLDIASTFEDYVENYALPFYTMFKFNAVFNIYNFPSIFNLTPAKTSGIELLKNTKPELLCKAANDLDKELTFLVLAATY